MKNAPAGGAKVGEPTSRRNEKAARIARGGLNGFALLAGADLPALQELALLQPLAFAGFVPSTRSQHLRIQQSKNLPSQPPLARAVGLSAGLSHHVAIIRQRLSKAGFCRLRQKIGDCGLSDLTVVGSIGRFLLDQSPNFCPTDAPASRLER